MTASLVGLLSWEGSRDSQTYRDYNAKFLIRTTSTSDGPLVVMNCPGLPAIGSIYSLGNDVDGWAFCYPDLKIKIHDEKEGDPANFWTAELKFSTKPLYRCMDTQVTDPMQEPQKVSGSFVKYTRERRFDRFGYLITNSALEPIRGGDVEFDANRPSIRIEQNVLSLDLPNLGGFVDTVNGYTLWGMPPRTIKLSDISWERKTYGVCNYYYTRTFNFDIDSSTFDRNIGDVGTQVLKGKWDPATGIYHVLAGADRFNPQHFIRYEDINGNPATVVLNGAGLPSGSVIITGTGTGTSGSGGAGFIHIEAYPESDFTYLGIPTTF